MTPTTDNLLTCPFCNGSEAHNCLTVFETSAGVPSDGTHFYVHCAYCGAHGPKAYNRHQAVREWNKRVHDASGLVDALQVAINHIKGVTGCNPGSDSEEIYINGLNALKKYQEGAE